MFHPIAMLGFNIHPFMISRVWAKAMEPVGAWLREIRVSKTRAEHSAGKACKVSWSGYGKEGV